MICAEMPPNLTGLPVRPWAAFHTLSYSSGPRPTLPITLGGSRVSMTSYMMSPGSLSRFEAISALLISGSPSPAMRSKA